MRSIFAVTVLVLASCMSSDQNPSETEIPAMPAPVIKQFEKACEQLVEEKNGGGSLTSLGRDGWCYHISELRYAAAGPFFGKGARRTFSEASPKDANPFTAIIDFRDQLEAHGIELVFIPIPVRPVIYPEGVIPLGIYADSEPLPHLKPMQDEFLEIVKQAGIDTINLSPHFLANRHHERGNLYCKSDTHWTPSATSLAADIVGRYLKSRPWYEAARIRYQDPARPFTAEWQDLRHFGDCYRKVQNATDIKNLVPDRLLYRRIDGPDIHGENEKLLRHPGAPVVILGDSNMIAWHGKKATFPQQLSFELGFHIDTLQSAGGGINQSRLDFVREIRKHPEYLEGKKAVIWTFTARSASQVRPFWVKTPIDAAL